MTDIKNTKAINCDISTIWTESAIKSEDHNVTYMNNSMARESVEMDSIRSAVQEAGMTVVLSYSERDGHTIYVAQVWP